MFKKILNWYTTRASLPYWLIGLTDCATVFLAGIAAYALNHTLSVAVGNLYGLMATVGVFMVCFVAGFRLFHTYSGIIRMTTAGDLSRIFGALATGGVLALALKQLTPVDSLMVKPFSARDIVTLIFLATTAMCGLRMTAKLFYDLYLRYSTAGGAYGYASKDLLSMEMSDLLQRDPIDVDMDAIRDAMAGRCIMVTGAAGSIGSELAYLLATVGPSELVLIDQAESPLHDVRINMARLHPGLRCRTIVTSICHSSRMDRIFAEYKPEYVFHAAAYKHVPMMEDNPVERAQQHRRHAQDCRPRREARRAQVRHGEHRQGRQPHQRHGLLEAHLRDVLSGAVRLGLAHAVHHHPLWQRAGL